MTISINDCAALITTCHRFLHQFPSVQREVAIAVLDAAYETVAADANIA
jgi:hypothetical protein